MYSYSDNYDVTVSQCESTRAMTYGNCYMWGIVSSHVMYAGYSL